MFRNQQTFYETNDIEMVTRSNTQMAFHNKVRSPADTKL